MLKLKFPCKATLEANKAAKIEKSAAKKNKVNSLLPTVFVDEDVISSQNVFSHGRSSSSSAATTKMFGWKPSSVKSTKYLLDNYSSPPPSPGLVLTGQTTLSPTKDLVLNEEKKISVKSENKSFSTSSGKNHAWKRKQGAIDLTGSGDDIDSSEVEITWDENYDSVVSVSKVRHFSCFLFFFDQFLDNSGHWNPFCLSACCGRMEL
jgi:hypothetical protein